MQPFLPPPLDAEQERAVALLASERRFVLVGHVRPDGDCFGAQAALARVLEVLGKEVWVLNSDLPDRAFEHLARHCAYRRFTGGDLPVHDVAVLLDAHELDRCGPLAPALREAPSRKLVVDHHVVRGPAWWDASFVDSRAAATGLLVRRIARALDVPLDRTAALGVFTSIVTDTGWFKHSNADAETFAVAAELVALGVDPARVHAGLRERRGEDHPRALGRALARLVYHGDGRLAVVGLPRAEVGEERGPADAVEVLDILRSVERVEVVVLARETAQGTCRVSLRSKARVDVEELARRFGGGGHVRAAGAEIPGSWAEVEPRLVAAALELLEGAETPEDVAPRARRA